MKISLKKYLLYSSVFSIFTEAFMFRSIIDIKLLYLILIINFALLIKVKQIKLNFYFVCLLLFFLIHGLIAYGYLGITPNYLISQILGIGVIGVYYYNLIPLFETKQIIKVYLKICLGVAAIGFPIYFIHNYFLIIWLGDLRFHSIFTEPAHYAIIVIPACYYFLKTKEYLNFFVIFGSLILTESSIALIGCGLMFVLPLINLKRIGYLVLILPFVFGVIYIIYLNNEKVKLRFDDTFKSISAISSGRFDNSTNVSTYALISNLYVAKCNFMDHPLGSGLGSYYYVYNNEYFKRLKPPEYIKTLKLDKINASDAASLFFRIISELGLFGLLLIFILLYKTSNVFKSNKFIFAQGLFIYFLLKLFRDGHYFPPEFYFFIWLFYFSIKEDKKILPKQ